MITTMNNFETDQDTLEIEYGEEIMNVGWNPAVELVYKLIQVPTDAQKAIVDELPKMGTLADVSTAVSDLFLRKMNSYHC
jgi:hypothetical protein